MSKSKTDVQAQNVPRLRFPGFEGEWENTTLGKISKFESGGTPNKDNPLFWNGEIPWISASSMKGNEFFDSVFKTTENGLKAGSRLACKGSILILVRGSMLFNKIPVGIVTRDVAFNQDVKSIILKNRDSSKFVLHLLLSSERRLLNKVTGTGIGAGKIDLDDLKSMAIFIPSLPEQTRIAAFLSAVDTRIGLLKKKKEALERYKKGAMQKIFSQTIRFRDDDGREFPDWEEKRLGEIIIEFIVPMRDKPKDLSGNIPWCRIEDFNGKYLYYSKSKQGVSKTIIKTMNLKVFPIDTLLVSCSAYLGKCAIVKNNLVTNQTFIGLVPNKKLIDIEFLYYEMRLNEIKLNRLSSGTTISYLSREEFEKFEINLPSLPEQRKIADFLSALDAAIDRVAEQIAKTETWKRGLLQGMFVS